ncbi:hypothetical protein ACMATS_06380 [Streptoverticillium reticulum]|uniref:hypothetical protein n=1 Tax=Streptoverticillium reticulum TaxID=1433415 RepID=UPI0039BFB17A
MTTGHEDDYIRQLAAELATALATPPADTMTPAERLFHRLLEERRVARKNYHQACEDVARHHTGAPGITTGTDAALLERALIAHRTYDAHSRIEGLARALVAQYELSNGGRDSLFAQAHLTAARSIHAHLAAETGVQGAACAPVVADLGALLAEHDQDAFG